ncbi:MAG: hypothetical protein KF729_19210 [Sandaracinaceae bacterium]|nr:hypothetical protein [Sandaracinaceae bacterium]
MGEFTTPALIALLMLFPVTAFAVWAKRPPIAVLYVVFFATLFGPEGAFIKLPAVPPLDKHSLPYLFLFVVALVRWRPALARAHIGRGVDLLLVVAVVAGFITWQTNTDALRYGSWRTHEVQGLIFNDGLQYGVSALLSVFLPFLLGRAFFRSRRDVVDLLKFLGASALVQTLFLLVEIRLSPQWHTWVYGYGAHLDFLQTMRWGGYRPMNFMAHGLALSLFMCVAMLGAAVLAKRDDTVYRWPAKRVALGLFVIVVICKSTGSIMYAAAFGALIAFASPVAQVRTAFAVACFVAIYPMLRAFDWFPAEGLVEQATAAFGEDRAQSLEFRFDNELVLLEKARERLWFGWGGFGRASVYSADDGRESSIADGHWIIVLGIHGVVGFVTRFGPLLIPVLLAALRLARFRFPADRTLVAGLTVICAVLALDLIPNGLFATYPYVLAGALLGVLQESARKGGAWSKEPAPARVRGRRRVSTPDPRAASARPS